MATASAFLASKVVISFFNLFKVIFTSTNSAFKLFNLEVIDIISVLKEEIASYSSVVWESILVVLL